MTLAFLLLACSSPITNVSAGAHPDAPKPAKLNEVLDRQIKRPIETCYHEALKADPSLTGTVAYKVKGSHGVLESNLTVPGPEALQTCALKPMTNQRLLRNLGDGDDMVGFTITVNFSPD